MEANYITDFTAGLLKGSFFRIILYGANIRGTFFGSFGSVEVGTAIKYCVAAVQGGTVALNLIRIGGSLTVHRLIYMYPEAIIESLQLSIDLSRALQFH